MKYQAKSFSISVGSKEYAANFDAIFRKNAESAPAYQKVEQLELPLVTPESDEST